MTKEDYYKQINDTIDYIKEQEKKNPFYLTYQYLKTVPLTNIDYADNLTTKLIDQFNKGIHVCEVGYEKNTNVFSGYCYVQTIVELLQTKDTTRNYYLFNRNETEMRLTHIEAELLEEIFVRIARELDKNATKPQIICIDHVREMRELVYPFAIEHVVEKTKQYKNVQFLFFDTNYNLRSYRLKKRPIYQIPRPKRKELQKYIELLAKQTGVYNKIKKKKVYFDKLAAEGECWRKGNKFDNSKDMFYEMLDYIKETGKDINDVNFIEATEPKN